MAGKWTKVLAEWGAVLLGVAAVILIPLYHGLGCFYLANSDQDIDLTYMALMLNGGHDLPFHPHTGFGFVILLAPWLDAARHLGLIAVSSVDPLIDSAVFDEAYTQIVAAGRALTIVFAVIATLVFMAVARLACNERRIAALATLVFATSLGIGYQFTVLRTELLSMTALLGALGLLLATRRQGGWPAVFRLGAAGFLVMFAALVKVQAVVIAMMLPLVPFLFSPPAKVCPAPSRRALAVCAVVAMAIGGVGLVRLAAAAAMGPSHGYQIALAVLIVLAGLAYGRLRLGDATWGVAGLMGLSAGIGLGATLVYVSDHWWTLYGITNFVEFRGSNRRSEMDGSGTGAGAMIAALWHFGGDALTDVLLRFRSGPRDYPLQITYLWAIGAGLWLVVRGDRLAGLRILAFVAAALGLIMLFSLRDYTYYYQIYVEPLFILAAAMATAAIAATSRHRHWVIVAAALVTLYIGATTTRFRLLAPSTAQTRGPEHACCSRDFATLIGKHFEPECAKATVACPLSWEAMRAMQDVYLGKIPRQ